MFEGRVQETACHLAIMLVCVMVTSPLSSSPSSGQTYVATPERDGLYLPQISSGEKINKYNSSLCENVCV